MSDAPFERHESRRQRRRRRRRSEPRRRRRGVYLLPQLFTTANLFFGFYTIVQALAGNFFNASLGIVFAGICDALDGRVARLSRPPASSASSTTRSPTLCRSGWRRRSSPTTPAISRASGAVAS
jgi:hypothetical protein